MSTPLILTKPQAEAVYCAMSALRNVGASVKVSIPPVEESGRWVFVEECADSGQITLTRGLRREACHSNQAAFASAYGLAADAAGIEKTADGCVSRVDIDFWPAWMAENPLLFVQRVNEFLDRYAAEEWESGISRFACRTRLTAVRKADIGSIASAVRSCLQTGA